MYHHRMKSALLTAITITSIVPLTACGRTPLDPFEKLNVEFQGVSGYSGEANVDSRQCESYLVYFCSKYDMLSNGDTITITVSSGDELLKKNGVKLTATEKEYVVEGLSEFPSELTDAEADQLTEDLRNLSASYAPNTLPSVGDEIKLTNIKDDELHDEMKYGSWVCESVSEKIADYRSYDIWDYRDTYGFDDSSKKINMFTVIWRIDITVKCEEISDSSRSRAEMYGEALPSIGDTLTYPLYISHYISGIVRNGSELEDELSFGYSTWKETGQHCYNSYSKEDLLQAVQADFVEFSDSELLSSIEY